MREELELQVPNLNWEATAMVMWRASRRFARPLADVEGLPQAWAPRHCSVSLHLCTNCMNEVWIRQ